MKLYPPWGSCHCGQGYSFPDVRQEGRVWRLWWKCMAGHFRYQVIDLEEGT